MAAATAPVINSAGILESGISEIKKSDPVLPSEQSGVTHPQWNVRVQVVSPADLPDPRPQHIFLGAIKDPELRVLRAIPLDVSVEESMVIVNWAEIEEFGSGANLSEAIDDFSQALRELYHRLSESGIQLGSDLEKVKGILGEYIQRRTHEGA